MFVRHMLNIYATRLEKFGCVTLLILQTHVVDSEILSIWILSGHSDRCIFLFSISCLQVQEDDLWNNFDEFKLMEHHGLEASIYMHAKQRAEQTVGELLETRVNNKGYAMVIF